MCKNSVTLKRKYGAMFWIMIFLTGGLWVVTIPFKKHKVCPVCNSIIK
ncbi:hypothetical protein CloPEP1_0069 [Clostridium phage Clo-PEP-1]|nr:hypothetical protein CloPEP1_0069 [Clostridium phage Clo-PEP-1]